MRPKTRFEKVDLPDNRAHLRDIKKLAKTIKKAEYRTPLSQVVQQSIQQEIELFDGFGEDKEDFAVFSVVLFFQELYVFQLKFTNWRGFNLKVRARLSRWHCGA